MGLQTDIQSLIEAGPSADRDSARADVLWTLAGLIIVIVSGLLIFSSDPIMYLHNASFKYKVTNLMLAIIFNYTVHRRVAQAAPPADAPQKSGGAIG